MGRHSHRTGRELTATPEWRATMAESTKPISLRRELRLGHTIAVSVAMITPTMAIALNTAGAAGLVGRAVPLAFLFAAVGVALVAYAFISIARRISHAGSA